MPRKRTPQPDRLGAQDGAGMPPEVVAHELRRIILRRFRKADSGTSQSPKDLAEALDMPLSNVAYHCRVLAEAGAIELVETKQVRGSIRHFYTAPGLSIDWVTMILDAQAADDSAWLEQQVAKHHET